MYSNACIFDDANCNPCGGKQTTTEEVVQNKTSDVEYFPPRKNPSLYIKNLIDNESVISEEIDVDEFDEEKASPSPILPCSGRNILRAWIGLVVVASVILVTTLPRRNKSSDRSGPTVVSNVQEDETLTTFEPTPAPTSELELTLEYQILKPYVDMPKKLLDESTPQGQAFSQILSENISDDASFRIRQRFAMMTVFFATGGDQWAWTSGWDTFTEEECNWHGVAICRFRDGRRVVTGLHLPSNNIAGELPQEVCLLEDLESLLLGNNEFVGVIPACVVDLTSLFELDVHDNDFNGTPPAGLTSMMSLRKLDLSGNGLSGNLDFLVSDADLQTSKVTSLKLNNNAFTGTVPESLFLMEDLEEVTLHNNALNGDISKFCEVISGIQLSTDCSQVSCTDSCCTCYWHDDVKSVRGSFEVDGV